MHYLCINIARINLNLCLGIKCVDSAYLFTFLIYYLDFLLKIALGYKG